MAPIDMSAIRKGVERLLRKARPSFIRPASPTQANLLVMQAPNIWFADKLMPDTLYGTEQFGVHKKPAGWSASVHSTAYFGLADFQIGVPGATSGKCTVSALAQNTTLWPG
jgi:hypothetical protein